MSPLRIQNNNSNDFTLVSNRFLDIYMPEANGEFIKIYLYLLHYSVGPVLPPSFETMADTLNCTEKDIERALNYWCKKGILALSFDDKKHITDITFFDLSTEAAPKTKAIDKAPASDRKAQPTMDNEAFKSIQFVAEQYLGKLLSKADADRFKYFYKELHFSPELIEHLIDYCVSNNHKSTRYMEKVAITWHEAGITTVAEAKEASNTYNKNYFSILKAFGISNRNPVDSELKLMNRWLNELGFSLDIITEACNRTITATGKPSFPYADSILTAWQKNDVHTLADVANLDKAHQEKKPATSKPVSRAKSPTKFSNFKQRSYDYGDLEKQLIEKQLQKSKIKE